MGDTTSDDAKGAEAIIAEAVFFGLFLDGNITQENAVAALVVYALGGDDDLAKKGFPMGICHGHFKLVGCVERDVAEAAADGFCRGRLEEVP